MNIDNNKPLAIIGGSHSGKTNFAIYCARQTSHSQRFLFGYPKDIEGFVSLCDISDLYKLQNCVLVIDEFQRYFKRNGRNGNNALEELLDFAEHRQVKLIVTAQNNQAIDRNLESRFKQWAIKAINVHTLKQGGMCKLALQCIKSYKITSHYLSLDKNEVLFFDIDADIGGNGICTFPDQHIGKDWKNVPKNVINNVKQVVTPKVITPIVPDMPIFATNNVSDTQTMEFIPGDKL